MLFAASRLPEFPGEEEAKAAIWTERERWRKRWQTDARKDNDRDTPTVTDRMRKEGR